MIKRWVGKLARTRYVRNAIKEKADLSAFRQRPSLRIIAGVSTMALSYVIGWPAVSLLAFLSAYYGKPLIVLIGGPLIYGISHLVFLLGMYLAGAKYTRIFFRWMTRVGMEKLKAFFPDAFENS